MEGRYTLIEGRLAALDRKLDAKVDGLNGKFDRLNAKIDSLGESLRREISTQFRWTMGVIVTLFTVFLGAVLAL